MFSFRDYPKENIQQSGYGEMVEWPLLGKNWGKSDTNLLHCHFSHHELHTKSSRDWPKRKHATYRTRRKFEIKNTHFMFKTFSSKSSPLWDNVEKYSTIRQITDDKIIRRMQIACWMTKTTDTHSEYVTLFGFRRQKWLYECTSMFICVHVYLR
jgi:hypothetical protein